MKRKNPVRALLEELRKDSQKDGGLSPDDEFRRRNIVAGFERLNAWKKRTSGTRRAAKPIRDVVKDVAKDVA